MNPLVRGNNLVSAEVYLWIDVSFNVQGKNPCKLYALFIIIGSVEVPLMQSSFVVK